MIEKLRALYRQALIGSGREAVGFFCSYVPVEIVEAAGCRPVRLAGRGGSAAEDEALGLVSPEACSFCKDAIGLKLLNESPYNCFKKLIVPTTCDQMRRHGEIWERELGVEVFFLNVPATWGRSLTLYEDEIRGLAAWLGSDTRRLKRVIKRTNDLRARMLNFRQRLTAGEFHLLAHLWFVSDIDFFEQALKEIEQSALDGAEVEYGLRILLGGGPLALEDSRIFDIIEQFDAGVVDDTLCTGRRECDLVIEDGTDSIKAIAQAYFERPPCIWKRPNDRYFSYLQEIVERQKIDGVVFKTLKYCDVWNVEAYRIREKLNPPVLVLETTYGSSSRAQTASRVEAFIEMLEHEKSQIRH